jgi:hypothetical protein
MSRAALAATSASTQAVLPFMAALISAVTPCEVHAQVTHIPPSLPLTWCLTLLDAFAYSFSVILTLFALITQTNPINLKTWITLISQETLPVLISRITIKTLQNLTDKSHNPSISKPQKHLITTRSHDHTQGKSAKLIKPNCRVLIRTNPTLVIIALPSQNAITKL